MKMFSRLCGLILFLIIFWLLPFAYGGDIVLFDASDKSSCATYHNSNKPVLSDSDGALLLRTGLSRIKLPCPPNMSENLDIQIDAENLDDKRIARLEAHLCSNPVAAFDNVLRGKDFILAPLSRGVKTICLADPALNPPVREKFRGMRADPLGGGDRAPFPNDMKNVSYLVVGNAWTCGGGNIKIRSVKALDSSHRKYPQWMKLPPEKFFPFVDRYGQFKHKSWKGKISSDEDLILAKEDERKDLSSNPPPQDWNRFGGWKNGPKLESSGKFRVQKFSGKWYFVDPDGNLFWSHGIVRISPHCGQTPLDGREFYFETLPSAGSEYSIFYETKDELLAPYYTKRGIERTFDFSASNIRRKYGSDWLYRFADIVKKRLPSWGINTVANGSDRFVLSFVRQPYAERFEIYSKSLAGDYGWWWPFPDPFDESFSRELEEKLKSFKYAIDDPYCIGLFVDNEIHWGGDGFLAEKVLMSGPDCAAKRHFMADMKSKYHSIERFNTAWKTNLNNWDDFLHLKAPPSGADKEDMRNFSDKVCNEYFSKIKDAFNRFAPGVLYLGCRFAGSPARVLKIAAKYCDVLSFNIYRDSLRDFSLPAGIDKPVLIGEFHFGATDRGLCHPSLAARANQAQRAGAYYNYVFSALRHGNIVGTHWHQFSDQPISGRFDGENLQVGFTDICDTPYAELVEAARRIGKNMYSIRSAHHAKYPEAMLEINCDSK